MKAKYYVACGEAVARAVNDTPGTVEKVSVGDELIIDGSSETLQRVTKTVWKVDITLKEPFVAKSGKQLTRLRVMIGANEELGINRRPIE